MRHKKKIIWGIRLLLVLLPVYAFWIEPGWIQVTIVPVSHPDRAGNTEHAAPIRVALLTDLHLQELGSRERRLLDDLHALKPDLVILAGDVVDRPQALPELARFLARLPDVPKLATLGNWEYWGGVDIETLRQLYQGTYGIPLLVNQVQTYVFKGRRLGVTGMDDATAGSPDARLLLNLPEADLNLLVQHSPGFFESLPARQDTRHKFDLCLAGHTHAGQVTLFGWAFLTPPGSGEFVAGRYPLDLCPLYVSRGLGTSVLPVRFWARPEVLVFDL